MANENTLGSKVSLDITDFKTGVSQLTASIKSIEAGFRASAAVMGNWSSSTNGLQERTTSLSQKLDLQKQKLNILHEEYDKVVKSSGATGSAAESLANKMFSAEKAIASTEKDLAKYREQLNSVKKSEEEATNPLSKMKTSFLQMAEQSKKSTSSMKEHFGSLKSTIAGAVAGIGLSLGVTGLAKSIYGIAESASDLVEAQNVVENTFKKSSQAVENWTNSTAKSAGIGKTAATQMVGAMGAMMQSSGLTEKASSSMSEKLVQLTGDLSSFYNVGTSDMWEKIRAGISGETKPLKDLGINMSEANLSAFALSEGIKTAYSKMSQSEQVTLRYNYLLSVTKNAQGDFARTSATSMANQSRIFQMNINNMKQTIGATFLPSINSAYNAINPLFQQAIPKVSAAVQALANNIKTHKNDIVNAVKSVITVAQNIFGFVESHGDLVKGAVIGIATAVGVWKTAMLAANTVSTIHGALMALGIVQDGAAAAAKTANTAATEGETVAQTGLNAVLTANPIGLVIAAIAALAAAAYLIIKNWGSISKFFSGVWDGIKGAFAGAGNWFKNTFEGAKNAVQGAWSNVSGFFGKVGGSIKKGFEDGAKGSGTPLQNMVTNSLNMYKTMLSKLGTMIQKSPVGQWFANAFNSAKSAVTGAMNSISTAVQNAINFITAPIKNAIEWVKMQILMQETFVDSAYNRIKSLFTNAINSIKNSIGGAVNGFKTAAQGFLGLIKNIVVGPILLLIDLITGNFTKLQSDLQGIGNNIKNSALAVWNGLKQGITGIGQAIYTAVTTVFKSLQIALTEIWNIVSTEAYNVWLRIQAKLIEVWNSIVATAKTAWTNFLNFFPWLWGQITTGATNAWNSITSFLSRTWTNISNTAKAAWNGLWAAINSLCNTIKNGIINIWSGIINWFRNLPNTLRTIGVNMFTYMRNGINSVIGTVTSAVKNGLNTAINWIKNLPGEALNWGRDIIMGIVNGIKSAASHVRDAVNGIAQDIRKFLHFSEPDEGPLKDFHTWMPDFLGGLADGITASKYKVAQAIQGLSSDMSIGVKAQMQPAYAGAYMPQQTTMQNNVSLPKYLYATINLDGRQIGVSITPIVGKNLESNAQHLSLARG